MSQMLKAYVINMKIINSIITPPKKEIKEEIENQKTQNNKQYFKKTMFIIPPIIL